MDNNLLKKIQALLSKTTENGCSVAEAATSAALAQKLIEQHKLSMADVVGYEDDEPIDEADVASFSGARSITWKERLIAGLANANDVVMFIHKSYYPRTNISYKLVGRKSDTQIVDYMFNVLVNEIERVCKYEMTKAGGQGKSWSNSFKLGAVNSVLTNITATKKAARENASGAALVKIDSRMTDVKKWVDLNLNLKTKQSTVQNIDGSAYGSGQRAGNNISVNAGLNASTKMTKMLQNS